MDFRVTDGQKELAKAVREFCTRRVPRLRELEGKPPRSLFADLAELGVFSLCLPESAGGLDRPFADAVLIFEELGRALVPGPLVWTHLAAGLLAGAGGGGVVVGGLDLPRRSPASEVDTGAGLPVMVEHLADVDVLLVLHEDKVERLEARRLSMKPVEVPLDPLTPMGFLEALPAGERVGGPEDAARLRLEGTTLVAAQMLGIAGATLALAVEYAKVREQFGRPIGAFQAIKHILADMFVRLEVARAAVYAAGATVDTPEVGDVHRAVATAKLEAGEAAILNAKACIQVHGGMGYTWEIPAHYYLKRAWALESLLGTREEHADAIATRFSA